MQNIANKITFFYAIEEKIWNEKVDANQYFGTLCILLVAISGALVGSSDILGNWFGWNLNVSLLGTVGSCIVIWGLNVGESIIATTTVKTAVLRSLLMLIVMIFLFLLGYAFAGIVIIVVSLMVTVIFFIFFITMLLGTGKTATLINTKTGKKVNVKDMGTLGYTDSGGEIYEKDTNGTWSKSK